jgi:hypothetical protein
MIPPSPLLSARMMRITYFTETTIINAQKIVDRPPRTFLALRGMPWSGLKVSRLIYMLSSLGKIVEAQQVSERLDAIDRVLKRRG